MEGGDFRAFNPGDSAKWTFYAVAGPPRCPFGCPPLIGFPYSAAIGADGTIYLGNNDGNLYALNRDGTQKWSIAGPAGEPVVGADGTLYVAAGSLYAIR